MIAGSAEDTVEEEEEEELNYNWAKLTYLRCNTLHLRNL